MSLASHHMLTYCHKHSSEKLHLVLRLQKCCQHSDAAQETLFDITNQAGLQSGLVASGIMVDFEAASGPSDSLVSFLLCKAVLAQCLVSGYNSLLF